MKTSSNYETLCKLIQTIKAYLSQYIHQFPEGMLHYGTEEELYKGRHQKYSQKPIAQQNSL